MNRTEKERASAEASAGASADEGSGRESWLNWLVEWAGWMEWSEWGQRVTAGGWCVWFALPRLAWRRRRRRTLIAPEAGKLAPVYLKVTEDGGGSRMAAMVTMITLTQNSSLDMLPYLVHHTYHIIYSNPKTQLLIVLKSPKRKKLKKHQSYSTTRDA